MNPRPDYGYTSYQGSGKLQGKVAIITGIANVLRWSEDSMSSLSCTVNIGGDSGIGRAVALAYAREGASVIISYLNETEDAEEIQAVIQKEGHECILIVNNFGRMNISPSFDFLSLVISVKKSNVERSLMTQ